MLSVKEVEELQYPFIETDTEYRNIKIYVDANGERQVASIRTYEAEVFPVDILTEKATKLFDEGLLVKEIADKLGTSSSYLYKIIREHRKAINAKRRQRSE